MANEQEWQELAEGALIKVRELKADLNTATTKIKENTELLAKSTEDIHVLLAFIKSKGLTPPTIHQT